MGGAGEPLANSGKRRPERHRPTEPKEGSVLVQGDTVSIASIELNSKEIASYLQPLSPRQRVEKTETALKIGFMSLERAATHLDLEFVRGEIRGLLVDVKGTVGEIPDNLEKTLSGRLGAKEGPVLQPILASVEKAQEVVYRKLSEVQSLLSDDIDPRKESSTIAVALRTIRELLDPKSPNSVQGAMQQALADMEKEDGTLARIKTMVDPEHEGSIQKALEQSVAALTSSDGDLLKTVRKVVSETVEPLSKRMDLLTLTVKGEEAAEGARMEGVKGGARYEAEVVLERLSAWASLSGARVTHVGPDNQPGDVLVVIPPAVPGQSPVRVIVEAKSEGEKAAKGRIAISRILKDSLETRKADAAVYISETAEGLRQEIHDWAEGEIGASPWVATVDENLLTAVRYVAAMRRLQLLARETSKHRPDVSSQVVTIRTALNHLKNINTTCATLSEATENIREETREMREQVDDALTEIEARLTKAEK
jgi:hypothetical protein